MRVLLRLLVMGSVGLWSFAAHPAIGAPAFQVSESPSPEPTTEPTPVPTTEPSPEPTLAPSPEPTTGSTPAPTTEPTGAPSETSATVTGSGSDGGPEDAGETPVAWWQWVLLALLLVGGLAAMTLARRRPPTRDEAGQGRQVLLAQIQRLATRSSEVAPTDEEIQYQRATVEALMPLLRAEVGREPEADTRRRLEGVFVALASLGRALKSARGTALRSDERSRVQTVASELDDRLAVIRSEITDEVDGET